MTVRFVAAPGLDELVAALIMAPEVTTVARHISIEGKRLAPPLKEWTSVGDARVRAQHVAAHGQQRPMNSRFSIPTHPWDREHRGLGQRTYLFYPGDQSDPRVVVNLYNCRCWITVDPDGIAKDVRSTPATVAGTRVQATAYAGGDWAAVAEFGDVESGDLDPSPGTRFMGRAAVAVAARRQMGRTDQAPYVPMPRYAAQKGDPRTRGWARRAEGLGPSGRGRR